MPFAGLGLHLLVALLFAVHAVRSGQQMYWLLILFSFPLLGSAVYFFAIYLPNSRLERGARQVVRQAAKAPDPTRELREARAEFEATVARHGSFEARAEYAIWAAETGDLALASRLHAEIERATQRWNRHTRTLNAETMRRLQQAYAGLNRAAG